MVSPGRPEPRPQPPRPRSPPRPPPGPAAAAAAAVSAGATSPPPPARTARGGPGPHPRQGEVGHELLEGPRLLGLPLRVQRDLLTELPRVGAARARRGGHGARPAPAGLGRRQRRGAPGGSAHPVAPQAARADARSLSSGATRQRSRRGPGASERPGARRGPPPRAGPALGAACWLGLPAPKPGLPRSRRASPPPGPTDRPTSRAPTALSPPSPAWWSPHTYLPVGKATPRPCVGAAGYHCPHPPASGWTLD